jgi:hypothetical protein
MIAAIKALLAGIGLKDYLYGALILAVITAGTTWYIHHNHVEQAIGQQTVLDADKKLADMTAKRNVAVTAAAQTLSDNLGATLAQTYASPPVSSPHVLCITATTSGRSNVPASTRDRPLAPEASDVPTASPVDIGPPLDTVGRDADANVNALIDEVIVLRNLLNGVKQ